MTKLTTLTFLAAGLLLGACSDDDNTTTNGNNQHQDATVQKDGTSQIDAATNQDASGPWTCEQIGNCANECGTDIDCVNDCRSHGCQSAQETFSQLMNCVITNCSNECMQHPQSTDCNDCRTSKCKDETQACYDNTCD